MCLFASRPFLFSLFLFPFPALLIYLFEELGLKKFCVEIFSSAVIFGEINQKTLAEKCNIFQNHTIRSLSYIYQIEESGKGIQRSV